MNEYLASTNLKVRSICDTHKKISCGKYKSEASWTLEVVMQVMALSPFSHSLVIMAYWLTFRMSTYMPDEDPYLLKHCTPSCMDLK